VPSAARLGGSTVTIIALVPHHSTVGWMMLSRVSEVGWGVAVGIATVWLVDKARGLSHRHDAGLS
jgi:NhaP-type Na+/H+ and K+/H+ antiporter